MTGKAIKPSDHYTYRIMWSDDDGEYAGLCAEFPSLSWLAETQEEALKGIRNMVKETVVDLRSNNEPVPQPLALRRFSGRLMVRIPPNVHRDLTIEAAEAMVSINRLVSYKLSAK